MTNYSDFEDFGGTREELAALKKELPTARAIVFDLRPAVAPSESDQGLASYGISGSGLPGLFTSLSVGIPGERRRMHVGYAPQDGSTSGDHSSVAIAPGWIETDMTAPVKTMPRNDEFFSRTPPGRWGQSEEIAGTAM